MTDETPSAVSVVDVREHERIARAATLGDQWRWRDRTVLEGINDAQVVLAADDECPPSIAEARHIAANSPPVVLALTSRIRELQAALQELVDETARDCGDPDDWADLRALLAKGVVIS